LVQNNEEQLLKSGDRGEGIGDKTDLLQDLGIFGGLCAGAGGGTEEQVGRIDPLKKALLWAIMGLFLQTKVGFEEQK